MATCNVCGCEAAKTSMIGDVVYCPDCYKRMMELSQGSREAFRWFTDENSLRFATPEAKKQIARVLERYANQYAENEENEEEENEDTAPTDSDEDMATCDVCGCEAAELFFVGEVAYCPDCYKRRAELINGDEDAYNWFSDENNLRNATQEAKEIIAYLLKCYADEQAEKEEKEKTAPKDSEGIYNNIGDKIKGLAETIFVIGVISAIIFFITTFAFAVYIGANTYDSGSTVATIILVGLIITALDILVTWIGTWCLYGYGRLIENSDAMRMDIAEIKANRK